MRHFFSHHPITSVILLFLCMGCSSNDDMETPSPSQINQKAEYIYREHNESLFSVPLPEKKPPNHYPWEKINSGNHPQISKEFFRCKGSSLNPCHIVQIKNELQHHYDCAGIEKHGLPLREGKEFIYPILTELLNYLQTKTAKRIVITCGHRCPEHNIYADPSPENQYSKHMIGAEVSFYVQGLEDHPEQLITLIQNFYKESPRYRGQKDFEEFKRYEKNDTNVSTQPWHNKEIFIKLFKKKEGRNFDNRHPYPYISIQVRYDRDLNEKVIYTWDKAYRNYHRW